MGFVDIIRVKSETMEILKLNDKVSFKIGDDIVNYFVRDNYLEASLHNNNRKIFSMLNIKNPEEFCSRHYGYKERGGYWPSSKDNDFEALTNVVSALKELCNNYNNNKELKIGDRVKRNIKWEYGNQDIDSEGRQTLGTIIDLTGATYLRYRVQWDNGYIDAYPYDNTGIMLHEEKNELYNKYEDFELTYDYQIENPTHVVKCINEGWYNNINVGDIFEAYYSSLDNEFIIINNKGDKLGYQVTDFTVLKDLRESSSPSSKSTKQTNKKEDENLQRVENTESRTNRRAKPTICSRRQQVATRSRLKGNKTSSKTKRARASRAKIKPNLVISRYS
jgi:hypothetical protein